MSNKLVLITVKDPRDNSDIKIYEQTWTNHVKVNHSELDDCGGGQDCLSEIAKTLSQPDIIREGRDTLTEELFIRYTEVLEQGVYKGISVATRTQDNETFMTTAYYDVIKPSKGSVKYKKKGKNNNE
ncbi:hypothetical protein CRU92_01585 [Arcobacter sp. FW59]|nr:hypothetical protein CRU92_01585 [Arcobacter sp. FW59]